MKLKRTATALLAVASLAQGCESSSPQSAEPQVGEHVDALIGGVQANSAALDAIGTLGVVVKRQNCETGEVTSQFVYFCSASLVAPQTILTAKHCVDAIDGLRAPAPEYGWPGGEPAFAIGSDSNHPKRIVPVVDHERSPRNDGGLVALGHDIGVAHLLEAVTDIKPLKYAKLAPSAIGKTYGAIGFGIQDNTGKSGTRRAGSVEINATSGKFYELVFGDFETFKQWALTGDAPEGRALPPGLTSPLDGESDGGVGAIDADAGTDDGADWLDQYLHEVYDTTVLLDGYEAYVGNREGNAQICNGDSGSPLVKANSKGELIIYGVTSAGINSNRLVCDFGGVYAVFNDDSNAWLKKAVAWKDPCKGISSDGICVGDKAKRCTTIEEGPRRLTVTSCSLFGQTCAIASNNEAVCATPGEDPIVLPEPEQPSQCADLPVGDGDGGVADGSEFSALQAKVSKTIRVTLPKH